MKNNIGWVIALIVIGIGSFFGGIKYQQTRQPYQTRIEGFGQRNGFFQGRTRGGQMMNGNRMMFQPVNGEIVNVDEDSFTVKLEDGSSKIIILDDKTQINKADQVSKTDLKTGEKVAVFGQTNSDGSVTAQNIQLNPQLNRRMISPTGTK